MIATNEKTISWCMEMIHNSNFSVCGVLLEHSHTLGDCCCCPVTKSRLTLCDPTDAAHQASLPISWSLFKLMSIWVGEAIQPSHPFYVICPGYFSNLRSCGSGLHSLYSSHTGPWLIPKHTRPRSSLITTTAPPLPPEVYTIEKKSEKSPATHPSVSVPFLIFFMALFTPDMFQVCMLPASTCHTWNISSMRAETLPYFLLHST